MTDRDELRTQITEAIDHDKAASYDEGRRQSDKRSVWLIVSVAVVAVIAILGTLIASRAAIEVAATSRSLSDTRKVNAALAEQQKTDAAKLQQQIDALNTQRAAEGKPPVTSADVPDSGLSPDTKKLVQLVLAALPAPVPGPAGPSGPAGAPYTGPSPAPGVNGANGLNGADGENGASITNVTLTACVLTITVTDSDGSTDYPLGNVCGPQGSQGEPGPAGEPGPQGVSVTSTTYACASGDLTITTTYSSGTTESSVITSSPVCPKGKP